MAHLIEQTDGKWAFARSVLVEPAWHEGIVDPALVPVAATRDEWRIAAGLDYRFDRFELTGPDGQQFQTTSLYEGKRSGFFGHSRVWELGDRAGQSEYIGRPVSDEYEAVQPAEMFEYAELVAAAAADIGLAAHVAYAGSVGWGNRQFVTVEIPSLVVPGIDESVRRFVSMVSSIDGGLRWGAIMSEVATVCNNTIALNSAVADMIRGKAREARNWGWLEDRSGVGAVQLLHLKGMREKITAALETMAAALGWGDRIAQLSAELANRHCTDRQFQAIIDSLWKPPTSEALEPEGKRSHGDTLKLRRLEELQDAWTKAKVERGGATGWAAVQALTWVGSHASLGSMQDLSPDKAISQQFLGAGTELPRIVSSAVKRILSNCPQIVTIS